MTFDCSDDLSKVVDVEGGAAAAGVVIDAERAEVLHDGCLAGADAHVHQERTGPNGEAEAEARCTDDLVPVVDAVGNTRAARAPVRSCRDRPGCRSIARRRAASLFDAW